MCESKSIKSCEKTFDFSAKKNENVSLSDNLIIKYLLRNGDTFYFEVTEKGNFSDIQDSRISIWAMSENLGIVGVAYFDNYFCKFNIISTNQPEAFEDIEKELCH